MRITLEIQRFNTEKDKEPYFQEYEAEVEPTDRLLSVLLEIKDTRDPTLGFRKSCAHGVCGSDAMVINGKERLACKTLIRDVIADESTTIRIEPLRGLPVQRDLMVDQTRFFANYIQVEPYQIGEAPMPEKERVQSPEERQKIDDTTNCILCSSCYSSCPVIREKNPDFLGPAAIVNAARFLDDSRDEGFEERISKLDHPDGIWPCENHFECTRVCPRGIKITKHINLTKQKIKTHRSQ
jgi:succinate dehydrogenase / fumarate reductase iron-sulfur subunit